MKRKNYKQKGGENKSNTDNERVSDITKIDNALVRLLRWLGNLFIDTIFYDINRSINYALLFCILTFFILEFASFIVSMFGIDSVKFIGGWGYATYIVMAITFVIKIINDLFIFFNKINTDEKELKLSNYILLLFRGIISNFSTSIPYVLLISFLYSIFKILLQESRSKIINIEYLITTPVMFLNLTFLFLFLLFYTFLKNLFYKSSLIVYQIFLYLFMYLTVTIIFIYFISISIEKTLNNILEKIDEGDLGNLDDENNPDVYELPKRLSQYLILKDNPESEISGFAYFMSMVVLIFYIILDIALVIFFNRPRELMIANSILKRVIDWLYKNLNVEDKVLLANVM